MVATIPLCSPIKYASYGFILVGQFYSFFIAILIMFVCTFHCPFHFLSVPPPPHGWCRISSRIKNGMAQWNGRKLSNVLFPCDGNDKCKTNLLIELVWPLCGVFFFLIQTWQKAGGLFCPKKVFTCVSRVTGYNNIFCYALPFDNHALAQCWVLWVWIKIIWDGFFCLLNLNSVTQFLQLGLIFQLWKQNIQFTLTITFW